MATLVNASSPSTSPPHEQPCSPTGGDDTGPGTTTADPSTHHHHHHHQHHHHHHQRQQSSDSNIQHLAQEVAAMTASPARSGATADTQADQHLSSTRREDITHTQVRGDPQARADTAAYPTHGADDAQATAYRLHHHANDNDDHNNDDNDDNDNTAMMDDDDEQDGYGEEDAPHTHAFPSYSGGGHYDPAQHNHEQQHASDSQLPWAAMMETSFDSIPPELRPFLTMADSLGGVVPLAQASLQHQYDHQYEREYPGHDDDHDHQEYADEHHGHDHNDHDDRDDRDDHEEHHYHHYHHRHHHHDDHPAHDNHDQSHPEQHQGTESMPFFPFSPSTDARDSHSQDAHSFDGTPPAYVSTSSSGQTTASVPSGAHVAFSPNLFPTLPTAQSVTGLVSTPHPPLLTLASNPLQGISVIPTMSVVTPSGTLLLHHQPGAPLIPGMATHGNLAQAMITNGAAVVPPGSGASLPPSLQPARRRPQQQQQRQRLRRQPPSSSSTSSSSASSVSSSRLHTAAATVQPAVEGAGIGVPDAAGGVDGDDEDGGGGFDGHVAATVASSHPTNHHRQQILAAPHLHQHQHHQPRKSELTATTTAMTAGASGGGVSRRRRRNIPRFVQPQRSEFESDAAFEAALERWKSYREKNNASVRKSRERARERDQLCRRVLRDTEQRRQQLVATATTLRSNLRLLLRAFHADTTLTPLEAAWVQTLVRSKDGLQLATEASLTS
ncbi:hypothetical protein PTSG_04909 [Salpingoeca rosetta]|uniref:BZIP domain-containing protein n=1 Tax=Salpingoeca rosetta (strain ATCC 50818 / BSB-021) TaxID=946362 RepID=F2U8Z2_SALR5|nr:uncharacterized protein PTSG_04909 [Salpingoeca rosetta]EGD73195.1 hypothetical protein PTSG_04909 [Salpingoeca rosetta]|eukprot:XP_004994226.1 hypothetical protein PTSG_04909 [Salpingoeca rosetta]